MFLMGLRWAALLLSALAATPLAAQTPPPAPADPAKGQAIAAKVCSACHGADGNSLQAVNPVLAGQHADYTAKQLANFKAQDGKSPQRPSPIMTGMVAGLSADDMRNLAAYFEAQKPQQRAARDAKLVKLGQSIYRGGIPDKGVAACTACHGPAGAGIPAQFPRVAGQFAEYTSAQLKAFRTGARGNDPNGMMRAIAERLSDQEIDALADYLAGLR
jgi:cytochrome c553